MVCADGLVLLMHHRRIKQIDVQKGFQQSKMGSKLLATYGESRQGQPVEECGVGGDCERDLVLAARVHRHIGQRRPIGVIE